MSEPSTTGIAKRSKRRLWGTLLALAILAALIAGVDTHELWAALTTVTVGSFAYLLLISVLLIYISVLKWKLFIVRLGGSVSAARLFVLYLVGYFVNLILPSVVGGDAVRSYYLRGGISGHDAFAATILERYTGLVAMILLALVTMWWVPGVTVSSRVAVMLLAVAIVVGTFVALSPRLKKLIVRLPYGATLDRHCSKIQAGLTLGLSSPALLGKSMFLSLLFHCFTVLNTVVAGYAVGWIDAPIAELFVVLPLALLIGAIPLTPGGLGLQEGALVFFLMQTGATEAQALGIGLVLRAKVYVLAMFGGLGWLTVRNTKELSSGEPVQTITP